MAMIPWRRESPLARFEDPFELINKKMDDYFSSFWDRSLPTLASWDIKESGFMPTVNVRQGENSLTVTAELPGMDQKDIEVLVDGDQMTIKGEKRFKREGDDKDRHYVEASYGAFQRVLPLPYEVEKSSIKGHFQNGVLKVEAKRAETAKTNVHKVQIA